MPHHGVTVWVSRSNTNLFLSDSLPKCRIVCMVKRWTKMNPPKNQPNKHNSFLSHSRDSITHLSSQSIASSVSYTWLFQHLAAPAHPQATWVAVYPALFSFTIVSPNHVLQDVKCCHQIL